jgi:Ca2+-binding RTX toxin-like protein
MTTATKAFEGVQGYGAETRGGTGGEVVHVTTLADSGQGSLRWALETLSGPRTVVFDVSGTITLRNQILVENPNVTIAGQTAGGDGITIEGSRIRFKAGEAIVQGLKFRPGDGAIGQSPDDRDGIFIGTTDHVVKNIVIDHNTFTWATDENMTINGNVHNVTISNNIFAEGLSRSINPKGEHSKGLMISNWGSTDPNYVANISVIQNLFAHNTDRNPEVRAGQNIEIINNYIYDAGRLDRSVAIGAGNRGTLDTTVHVIGNVIDAGLSTTNLTRGPITLATMGSGSGVFLDDNVYLDRSGTTSQSQLVYNAGGARYLSDSEVFSGSNTTILDTADVRTSVLNNAGASPRDRDAIDARIIQSAVDGTGRLVDATAHVLNGYVAPVVRSPRDTDGDGMADWYESRFGHNVRQRDNNGDLDRDGFTNLQEYLHDLIVGFDGDQRGADARGVGTARKDVFAIGTNFADFTTVIENFDVANDVLDLSRILTAYNPSRDGLTSFLEVAEVNGSTMISIDRDGAGTAHTMEFVAELTGVDDVDAVWNAIVSVAGDSRTITPGGIELNEIVGTANADSLAGTESGDRIYGHEGNDRLAGRGGNDFIFGGAGNDMIDGGTGADLLAGGAGDDVYVIDNAQDVVDETNGFGVDTGGVDRVEAHVTHRLSSFVENLTLKGVGNIDGLGNELANVVLGNTGNNVLAGFEGNDNLRGNAGNDTLLGGSGADRLDGGIGNDRLMGGDGADYLYGGAGNDLFMLERPDASRQFDTIADFTIGQDLLGIDRALLGLSTPDAAFSADMLSIGTRATSADHRLVYDPRSGSVLLDADGSGAGEAIQIARMSSNLGLRAEHFALI